MLAGAQPGSLEVQAGAVVPGTLCPSVDHLVGLKENVIIGKLIPAGSGLNMYREFDKAAEETPAPVEEEDDVDLSVLLESGNAL